MSQNSELISFVSSPHFWQTIRAVHNHMLATKLDEWGHKRITRLGEILEGKYSDHLTAQHKQDEIDFVNKLIEFIHENSVSTAVGGFDIQRMTSILNNPTQNLTLEEKSFVGALRDFVQREVAGSVEQSVNNLKIVKVAGDIPLPNGAVVKPSPINPEEE